MMSNDLMWSASGRPLPFFVLLKNRIGAGILSPIDDQATSATTATVFFPNISVEGRALLRIFKELRFDLKFQIIKGKLPHETNGSKRSMKNTYCENKKVHQEKKYLFLPGCV